MAANQPATVVNGVVEQVGRKNGQLTGYKLQGRWYDISKFPWEPLPVAQVGQTIVATCVTSGQDDKPWIMKLQVFSQPGLSTPAASPNGTPSPGVPTLQPPLFSPRIQLRLRAAKIAAVYLQNRIDVSSTQVLLDTADEIARWIQDAPPPAPPSPARPVAVPEPDIEPDFVPDPPDEFPS